MIRFYLFLLVVCNYASATNFGALKRDEVNVRNGPGEDYQIVHKYLKTGLPVQILHRLDDWYLVRDFEDETGWVRVNAVSLSKKRGMIIYDNTPVCRLPIGSTKKCNKIAVLKQDVILGIDSCGHRWCRVIVNRLITGWVEKNKIWGV